MSEKLTDKQKKSITNLLMKGKSHRKIALEVLGRESRKSTVSDYVRNELIVSSKNDTTIQHAKILFVDIETAPLLGHLWSLWQNGIGLNQLTQDWHLLSFTAKWAHSDEIFYADQRDQLDIQDDTHLLELLWDLLDEADFVVGHNIRKFDMRKINARFILQGFDRPSTYRQIDTLEVAKRNFGFTSNKLEYLTDKLCTRYKKSKHKQFPGHLLWTECLNNNPEAWLEMEDYNKFDVLSNQELYEIFIPWDLKLPNFDLYVDTPLDMSVWVENGYHYTNLGKYQRYINKQTGQQKRGRTNLLSQEKRKTLLSNII